MTKEDILSELDFYTDEQLAKFVVRGIVTENELQQASGIAARWAAIQTQIETLRPKADPEPEPEPEPEPAHTQQQESTSWSWSEELKQTKNIMTLKAELKEVWADKDKQDKVDASYRTIIQYLRSSFCTVQDILNEIRNDYNWLGSDVVVRLINDGVIRPNDLGSIGIDRDFIEMLRHPKNRVPFPSHVMPEPITQESTEIYFWGMPSSGKTCAICAILGTLKNGNVVEYMEPDASCSGFGYISMATDMFKSYNGQNLTLLPLGTAETAFYELGLQIMDKNGRIHPITCVDMAGETIRSMYKSNANLPLENYQVEVLECLNNILTRNHKPGNRMIHVFVVEYGAENRRYEGLDQITLLESASNYLKNLQLQKKKLFKTVRYGIFEEDADGIYVMVTKADKMHAEGQALRHATMDYLQGVYGNFYRSLQNICQRYNINGGQLITIPFSIGQTCFQDFCRFDSSASRRFVERIMVERNYGYKDSAVKGFLKK
mgnify:FL=1